MFLTVDVPFQANHRALLPYRQLSHHDKQLSTDLRLLTPHCTLIGLIFVVHQLGPAIRERHALDKEST